MGSEDRELIKALTPFNDMSDADLHEILKSAKLTPVSQGKLSFKRSDEDSKMYWLISRSIDLLDEKFEAKNRKAGEEVTKNAIDNNFPHRLNAVSTEESKILVLERDDLGVLGSAGTDAGTATAVEEAEEGIDWMSTLLSSPLFEFIPTANIQTLFTKFEEMQYEKGDLVIAQGEQGDFFYVIQSGRAKVERSSGEKTVVLAELQPGDNFGQDALVSDVPRNATVTMLTAGVIMRLSAEDFESLLMSSVIETVSMEEAQEMVEQGDPKTYIIDVRNPKEVEEKKIPGSLNIPLLLIRKNLTKLKPEGVYVMACDGGKRAELGAYILNENGFSAYVLNQVSES
ncbi:MAG: cyclic nucleotide-binding domain-containing protein [Pseudomonadales bacterium]|nr:cyclic nucleotide-binding domain-containing protein [Pseudomonadales bacterium]